MRSVSEISGGWDRDGTAQILRNEEDTVAQVGNGDSEDARSREAPLVFP